MVACGEEPHPGTPPSLDWWQMMGWWVEGGTCARMWRAM